MPPEQELEESFREPVISGRWVWAANPETGRVALIDTESLTITTGEAELEPTYLAPLASASPEESGALVINVGTSTASILHGESGLITSSSVPVHHGANALKVAPSSKLAIAWSNARLADDPDPTEGFQDITVIDIGSAGSRRLTVGYRPSRVFFDAKESTAFVVAESTISVIDLEDEDGPSVLRDVSLGADPNEAAASRDVTVTPDGKLALVRHEGGSRIDLIDLESGKQYGVSLPGPVTDLDLAPDASTAFAVVRGTPGGDSDGSAGAGGVNEGGEGGAAGSIGASGSAGEGGGSVGTAGSGGGSKASQGSQLIVLALPDILKDPSSFERLIFDDIVGSVEVAASGDVAVLYTNATASDHLIIVSMEGAASQWDVRTVLAKAPVEAVFPAADGKHAIAFLGQTPGSVMPGGYSIVPLSERLPPKIVGTKALPAGIAIAPAPSKSALVTVTDEESLSEVHVIRMPELSSDVVKLPSVPLAAGVVPETGRGFVAQRHAEGRITFVDLADGTPRTVTGFELAEKVHDGSD